MMIYAADIPDRCKTPDEERTMRLEPREADMAALTFLGRGRCYWPDCPQKICAYVDGKYVFDTVRAHIEAAEAGGPRWNKNMTDEERRAPENLMWLCEKHHKTVDRSVEKYTVAVLKEWKSTREAYDPNAKLIQDLTEERLEELINSSMERLADVFKDLDLPGMEVAEMLVSAAASMPDASVADLLYAASTGMPTSSTAEMLYEASTGMSTRSVAEMLIQATDALSGLSRSIPSSSDIETLFHATDRFPSRSDIETLSRVSNRFPDTDLPRRLGDEVTRLEVAIGRLQRAQVSAPTAITTGGAGKGKQAGIWGAVVGERDRTRTASTPQVVQTAQEISPWVWFGSGVLACVVLAVIVLFLTLHFSH